MSTGELLVEISDDGLHASIRLTDERIGVDELVDRLKLQGVSFGLDYRALARAAAGAGESVIVANGVAPTPPLADTVVDEVLDYFVEAGTVLARLGSKSAGRPGRTVGGAPIAPAGASPKPLRADAGVERDERDGVCRARVAGFPYLNGTRLGVRPAVEFSEDKMEAVMTLRAESGLPVDQVRAALNKAGVVFGIRPDWIERLIRRSAESGRPETDAVARGTAPKPGRSGTLRLRFPIAGSENGSPARRVLVAPNEVVADLSVPERGDPGTTVTGETVEGPMGAAIPVKTDETVEISDDGARLISRVAGYPYFSHGGIAVFPFVEVSADAMAATATIHPWPESHPTTRERVLAVFDAAGIRYGIDDAAVRELLSRVGGDGRPASGCVARGTPPVAGRDASVESSTARELTAGERRIDESTDFRARQVIPIVHAGDRVATRTPPAPGRDGKTVTGVLVPAAEPVDIPLAPGPNVTMSDDGREFTSTIDGLLVIDGSQIRVVETLAIDGDVDYQCGNIDCEIGVAVRGTVRSMFHVRARGPIRIQEAVEDAVVESDASIVVVGGIIQGAHGRIEAGGSVEAGFIEHARIRAGGDVVLRNGAIDSTVQAVGEVRVVERRGTIIGGVTAAGRRIHVRTAGSEMNVKTVLRVGVDFRALERLQEDFETVQAQVTRIRSTLGESIDALLESAPADPRVAAILDSYRGLAARRDRLVEERARLLSGTGCAGEGPAEIVVEENVHPNVRLIVRDQALQVHERLPGGVFRIDPGTGRIERK